MIVLVTLWFAVLLFRSSKGARREELQIWSDGRSSTILIVYERHWVATMLLPPLVPIACTRERFSSDKATPPLEIPIPQP